MTDGPFSEAIQKEAMLSALAMIDTMENRRKPPRDTTALAVILGAGLATLIAWTPAGPSHHQTKVDRETISTLLEMQREERETVRKLLVTQKEITLFINRAHQATPRPAPRPRQVPQPKPPQKKR